MNERRSSNSSMYNHCSSHDLIDSCLEHLKKHFVLVPLKCVRCSLVVQLQDFSSHVLCCGEGKVNVDMEQANIDRKNLAQKSHLDQKILEQRNVGQRMLEQSNIDGGVLEQRNLEKKAVKKEKLCTVVSDIFDKFKKVAEKPLPVAEKPLPNICKQASVSYFKEFEIKLFECHTCLTLYTSVEDWKQHLLAAHNRKKGVKINRESFSLCQICKTFVMGSREKCSKHCSKPVFFSIFNTINVKLNGFGRTIKGFACEVCRQTGSSLWEEHFGGTLHHNNQRVFYDIRYCSKCRIVFYGEQGQFWEHLFSMAHVLADFSAKCKVILTMTASFTEMLTDLTVKRLDGCWKRAFYCDVCRDLQLLAVGIDYKGCKCMVKPKVSYRCPNCVLTMFCSFDNFLAHHLCGGHKILKEQAAAAFNEAKACGKSPLKIKPSDTDVRDVVRVEASDVIYDKSVENCVVNGNKPVGGNLQGDLMLKRECEKGGKPAEKMACSKDPKMDAKDCGKVAHTLDLKVDGEEVANPSKKPAKLSKCGDIAQSSKPAESKSGGPLVEMGQSGSADHPFISVPFGEKENEEGKVSKIMSETEGGNASASSSISSNWDENDKKESNGASKSGNDTKEVDNLTDNLNNLVDENTKVEEVLARSVLLRGVPHAILMDRKRLKKILSKYDEILVKHFTKTREPGCLYLLGRSAVDVHKVISNDFAYLCEEFNCMELSVHYVERSLKGTVEQKKLSKICAATFSNITNLDEEVGQFVQSCVWEMNSPHSGSRVRYLQKALDGYVKELYAAMNMNFRPMIQSYVFGSRLLGLAHPNSDVDLYMQIGPTFTGCPEYMQSCLVKYVGGALIYHQDFINVNIISMARVPIVKFTHLPTKLNCDLSFKSGLSTMNSCLGRIMLNLDPRVRYVVSAFKVWTKQNDLSNPQHLTTYAQLWMVFYFLMQPDVGVLPSVQTLRETLRPDCRELLIEGWNAVVPNDVSWWRTRNERAKYLELLIKFFDFYADPGLVDYVLCTLTGEKIRKECFADGWMYLPKSKFKELKERLGGRDGRRVWEGMCNDFKGFCVQDPFDHLRNIAKPMGTEKYRAFVRLCGETRDMLAATQLEEIPSSLDQQN